jgi:hypothetical protein
MGIQMSWNDTSGKLNLHLASGSRMLPPERRVITVQWGEKTRSVTFEGNPTEVSF